MPKLQFTSSSSLTTYANIGFCSICGNDLSIADNNYKFKDSTDDRTLWIVTNLGRMIENSDKISKNATHERFITSVSQATENIVSGSAQKLCKIFGFRIFIIGLGVFKKCIYRDKRMIL